MILLTSRVWRFVWMLRSCAWRARRGWMRLALSLLCMLHLHVTAPSIFFSDPFVGHICVFVGKSCDVGPDLPVVSSSAV